MQDGGLFPHLTARENVTLVARHLRLGTRAHRPSGRRADHLDRAVTRAARPLPHRDLGRRTATGRDDASADARSPGAALRRAAGRRFDPLIRARLQQDLRDIFRQLKKSVLLVTHDVSEAAFLGDRIAVMERGSLLQKGAIDELVRRPATPFVAEFLQSERPRWSEGPPPVVSCGVRALSMAWTWVRARGRAALGDDVGVCGPPSRALC